MTCSKSDTSACIIRRSLKTSKKQMCLEGPLNLHESGGGDSGWVYLIPGPRVPISYQTRAFCTLFSAKDATVRSPSQGGQSQLTCGGRFVSGRDSAGR